DGIFALHGGDGQHLAGAAQRGLAAFRQARVADLARAHQFGQRAGGFLDGHGRVDAVQVEKVDVVGTQAGEAGLAGLADGFGPVVHQRAAIGTARQSALGGDEQARAHRCEYGADELLVLAELVAGGGVVVVDAGLHGGQQCGACLDVVTPAIPADQAHAAESDGKDRGRTPAHGAPPGGGGRDAAHRRGTIPHRARAGQARHPSRGVGYHSRLPLLSNTGIAMIIDCHGHYTTAPQPFVDFREAQKAALKDPAQTPSRASLKVSDDAIRDSLEKAQLKLQREPGSDLTIFSPRASTMRHHIGNESTSIEWSQINTALIARVVDLSPQNCVGVCMLPQSPGASLDASAKELERCAQMGFIGANLTPDPSGGHWTAPPLTDRYWYPVYE